MSMFRYYAAKPKAPPPAAAKAIHTNFLRTGRIEREVEDWVPEERRFLTEAEVAARTGMRLENAGRTTHQRLNTFHARIRFPEIIFHKTLAQAPHLGYVHVTASKADFAEYKDVTWGFYIANFSAEITADETFFHRISPRYSRMYFAVAMKPGDAAPHRPVLNREVRGNGLLFKTVDPTTALRNVLMLGAPTADLRRIVEAIG